MLLLRRLGLADQRRRRGRRYGASTQTPRPRGGTRRPGRLRRRSSGHHTPPPTSKGTPATLSALQTHKQTPPTANPGRAAGGCALALRTQRRSPEGRFVSGGPQRRSTRSPGELALRPYGPPGRRSCGLPVQLPHSWRTWAAWTIRHIRSTVDAYQSPIPRSANRHEARRQAARSRRRAASWSSSTSGTQPSRRHHGRDIGPLPWPAWLGTASTSNRAMARRYRFLPLGP